MNKINKDKEAFEGWSKKELKEALIRSCILKYDLIRWLYNNHLEVFRQYEDEELGGYI